jgi:hypothetical protein
MTKIDKLLNKFYSIPNDLAWSEFITILNHFGYNEIKTGKTSGSGRKFKGQKGLKFTCHAPHKPNIVKEYVIINFIKHIKGE